MNDQKPSESSTPRRGVISLVAAALLILLLIVLVVWWTSDEEPPAEPEPVPVEVSEPDEEPEPEPAFVPEPLPLPEPEPAPEPEPEPEPEVELPTLNESTAPLLATLQDEEQNVRPLRSEHLIRDMVIFIHNLRQGDVIRESAGVAPPDARFTTQTVDQQLYIDERSYARYDELVEWFTGLHSETLVNVFYAYQPLFEQAFAEIAPPDETFEGQLIEAIDVLLSTPEPEGLLALSDEQVMYTFADPELESLPAAQKQMLRLGLENQRKVKRKLREIRAHLQQAGADSGSASS